MNSVRMRRRRFLQLSGASIVAVGALGTGCGSLEPQPSELPTCEGGSCGGMSNADLRCFYSRKPNKPR